MHHSSRLMFGCHRKRKQFKYCYLPSPVVSGRETLWLIQNQVRRSRDPTLVTLTFPLRFLIDDKQPSAPPTTNNSNHLPCLTYTK